MEKDLASQKKKWCQHDSSWRTHILFKLMGIMAWLGGINQLPKSGQINLVWLINISYHLPKKLHGAVHQMTSTVYCQICCDIRSSGDILRQAQNDTDPKQQQTAFKHHNRKIGELSRTVISLMDNTYINTLRPKQNGRHFADDIFKCIFLKCMNFA